MQNAPTQITLDATVHNSTQLDYTVSFLDRALLQNPPQRELVPWERVFVLLEQNPKNQWVAKTFSTRKLRAQPNQVVLKGRVGHRGSDMFVEVYYGIERIHIPSGGPSFVSGKPINVRVSVRWGIATISKLYEKTGQLIYEESVF